MASLARALCRVAAASRFAAVARPLPQLARRRFAEAAASGAQIQSFLDRNEVAERVQSVLKNFEKVDASKVSATAHFSNDLGLDSLDAVEVCMALEEEFMITIPDAEAEKILSVEDAIVFIAAHPQAK